MNAKRTKQRSRRAERPLRGHADLARLRRQSDKAIAASSPAELAELPADFWKDAELVQPRKEAISFRVDEDVLDWFRSQGPRYQTRMNAVLRRYMQHARQRPITGAA